MKAQKIEDVEFKVDRTNEGIDVQIHCKEGELYLAVCNLLFTDGDTWYEVPVRELEHIDILAEDPLQLKFKLELVDVTVAGKRAERLMALRHFLLPYMKRGGLEGKLVDYLKFWALGIRENKALKVLLDTDDQDLDDIKERALDKGYLTDIGEMTEKGMSLFTEEDKIHLKRGGPE